MRSGSVSWSGKLRRELVASIDVELVKGVPEVRFDRSLGDEKSFRDLPVCAPFGG